MYIHINQRQRMMSLPNTPSSVNVSYFASFSKLIFHKYNTFLKPEFSHIYSPISINVLSFFLSSLSPLGFWIHHFLIASTVMFIIFTSLLSFRIYSN